MTRAILAACLAHRWAALGLAILVGAGGIWAWSELAIEAYPDIADTSAQVITQYPGHAAEEIEEQITVPIERALNGLPGLQVMRSKSTFGLSLVTLVFRDGIEDYWARQRIRERLEEAVLPEGASPGLDPLTSPTGEIYRYTLEAPAVPQRELTELQRWVVIPRLKQIFGVADVANFGGESTQFQVLLDPAKLAAHDIDLAMVVDAIGANNANAGGGMVVRGDQSIVVRGIGLVRSLTDLGNVVVSEQAGTPVFVRDVGTLTLGALARSGILGKDEDDDGVSGIVLLLRGENPSRVLAQVHAAVADLNAHGLPAGVQVVPYLDRTFLVHTTLHTVAHTLLVGMGLVVAVLLFFLGSLQGALVVSVTIPLALCVAFLLMHLTSVPANLLSLGAIDFGIIVDGAVVMVESLLVARELAPTEPLSREQATSAAVRVAKPIFFATLIIVTAYLPLFAFQRVEHKLFTPMAFTVGYALAGAVAVAILLVPGLAWAAYRRPRHVWKNPWVEAGRRHYAAFLGRLLRRPARALGPAVLGLLAAGVLSQVIGKEFLPELDEGSIWLQAQLPPGLSLAKASAMAKDLRQAVRASEEVLHVVTQLGRNDDGTDPWTFSHIESAVALHPYDSWPRGKTKHDLVAELRARLRQIPGMAVGFSQPMIDGVNDKIAGAHSELVVKIFGHDFAATRRAAEAAAAALAQVPGAVDVAIDQEPPLPQLAIKVDREAAARVGINASDIADLIEVGIGGRSIGQIFLHERRYDLAVRFVPEARSGVEAIACLTLKSPSGARIPLRQVAWVGLGAGESTITRESNRRHLTVKVNLRGQSLDVFLRRAHDALGREPALAAPDIEVAWGGQFENQRRARGRLAAILPAALALIFFILFVAFGSLRHAALILVNVPVATLGGMAALYLRGMTLNVSSAVGFIALFGVAVQNGVIMVSSLNRQAAGATSLAAAVAEGACARFRPVLMTATVAALGLIPAALARGIGSDVQRPLATVIVGGLFTSTLLTLYLLPALYLLQESWWRRRRALGPAPAATL